MVYLRLCDLQIVSEAVSSTDVLTGLHIGTQRALKQIIHVSETQ